MTTKYYLVDAAEGKQTKKNFEDLLSSINQRARINRQSVLITFAFQNEKFILSLRLVAKSQTGFSSAYKR